MCHVMLNPKEKESTKKMCNTDATSALAREPYKFINKSHRTLLMMRRTKSDGNAGGPNLELRHQRSGDVVFDWIDERNKFKTP